MRPERSRTMRSQRCASALSCVTRIERGAALDVAGEQQIDHLRAGGLVEIAGRLVGDQDRRIGRERAGERDALLLAAGKLRRIMMQPLGQADLGQFLARAVGTASAAPASSSGTATFSSAVMVGIRWKDWNTMPTLRPRKRASASSSSRRRSEPATTIEPVSARSSPASTISSVVLPEPGRADQANRLAAPYMQVDVFEDMDPGRGAAERKIDAGERDGRAVAAVEMSFMWPDAGVRLESAPRSYGKPGRKVQRLAAALRLPVAAGVDGGPGERGRADRSRSWRSAIR